MSLDVFSWAIEEATGYMNFRGLDFEEPPKVGYWVVNCAYLSAAVSTTVLSLSESQ
jgi:hypothetical protein